MHKKTCLVATLVLPLLVSSQLVSAKTPDGEPPSVESICDVFRGAEGPAFGLCNAYCEAIDCGDPNQAANDRACIRIRANFERKVPGFTLPTEYQEDEDGNVINNCYPDGEPEPPTF